MAALRQGATALRGLALRLDNTWDPGSVDKQELLLGPIPAAPGVGWQD